jgi:putative hydrolase of the HAD superfamily
MKNIDAIFLDLGNTLRILVKEEPHRARARREICRLLGVSDSPEIFCTELDRRYKQYRKWALDNLTEAPESELWSRWLAPEYPLETILPIASELTFQFRQSMGRRVLAESGKAVIFELYRRGYILGIISNVITSQEIPEWLEAEGLTPYFSAVVLSSTFGRRKPDPSIYLEAACRAGVAPSQCAYVGDNYSRDVRGTRAAGFGKAIILPDPLEEEQPDSPEFTPDVVITSLTGLLDIFPQKQSKSVSEPAVRIS